MKTKAARKQGGLNSEFFYRGVANLCKEYFTFRYLNTITRKFAFLQDKPHLFKQFLLNIIKNFKTV